jgi:hypothetical protein
LFCCCGELKLEKGDDFPTMEDFLELHEGAQYSLFAKEFLKRIIGEKAWRSNCYRMLLSEYCSASGESFGLLTLENNYERWVAMAESSDYGDKEGKAPDALYTNSGKSRGGRGAPKRFQGWSMDGYKRFDELHKLVKEDRAKLSRTAFEEELKHQLEEEFAKKQNRPKSSVEEEETDAYPAHDFDDVEMGGLSVSFEEGADESDTPDDRFAEEDTGNQEDDNDDDSSSNSTQDG